MLSAWTFVEESLNGKSVPGIVHRPLKHKPLLHIDLKFILTHRLFFKTKASVCVCICGSKTDVFGCCCFGQRCLIAVRQFYLCCILEEVDRKACDVFFCWLESDICIASAHVFTMNWYKQGCCQSQSDVLSIFMPLWGCCCASIFWRGKLTRKMWKSKHNMWRAMSYLVLACH